MRLRTASGAKTESPGHFSRRLRNFHEGANSPLRRFNMLLQGVGASVQDPERYVTQGLCIADPRTFAARLPRAAKAWIDGRASAYLYGRDCRSAEY